MTSPPERVLRRQLPAQPLAAAAVAAIVSDLLGDRPVPHAVLLVGPSGSGKTRTLRRVAELLGEVSCRTVDLEDPDAAEDLEDWVTRRRPAVLLLDGARARDLRGGAAIAGAMAEAASSASLLVVTLTVDDEAVDGESVAAHLGAINQPLDLDASRYLPQLVAAGAEPRQLAGFDLLVPFRSLGQDGLRRVLESLDDELLGEAFGAEVGLRIGPEASEMIVERAVRVGGGAWGLRAVLRGMLSGLLTGLDGADEAVSGPARRYARCRCGRSATARPSPDYEPGL